MTNNSSNPLYKGYVESSGSKATPNQHELVTDGGEDTVLPPSDQFREITDQHRERDGAGEVTMYGDIGFHSIFNPDRTEFGIGTNTALHIALYETLQMVHLDTGLVRDHHGEVTPETVSKELDEEIEAVVGRRFQERFVQNFREALEKAEDQYGEFEDDVDRGEGIETDGGEGMDQEPPSDAFAHDGGFDGGAPSSAATDPRLDQPQVVRNQQADSGETSVRVDLDTFDDARDIIDALDQDEAVAAPTDIEFHQRGSVSLHWEVQDR
jgi:hypothetical protein